MANLKYGSTGDDVKKLQEALGFTGNDIDGIFGQKTQQAVKDYQKANGLAVDGIAGKNTLGALYGTSTPATTTTTPTAGQKTADKGTPGTTTTGTGTPTTESPAAPVTSPGGFTYGDFSYADFAPSDIVNQANALIQQQQASKPGSYAPVWQDEADAYLNQYQNRGPFSYDYNSDALYNQYKDNYIQQGQMAMMDTMGQAAALTGGYGNSYAQSVGQQAYNQQLSRLNNILPELWQMAHDRYTQEGKDMLAMYDLYMNREAQEYGKYQDVMDNWYREMGRLTDNYNTLYDREYGEYMDKQNIAYNEYTSDKDRAWSEYLTNMDKEQTAAELLASAGSYDRLKEIYGLTDEEVAAIKAANTPKATGGGGGGGGGTALKSGTSAYNSFMSEINRADTPEALSNIIYAYQAMGFSLDSLNLIAANKIAELTPKSEQLPTGTPVTGDPITLMQSQKNQLGNMSGSTLGVLDTYLKLRK